MTKENKALYEQIHSWVDQNRKRIIEQVVDLVRFNTVNEIVTGREKEYQYYLSRVFHDLGLEVDLFSPEDVSGLHQHEAYFPGKDYTDRPNVVGKLKGTGKGKSIMFSCHADTAVVAPGWQGDPWQAKVEGDRLYGLGTFDMKGGQAASIMALACLRELGVQLEGDVLLESVVDEEFGGAHGTLASRLRGHNPDVAVIPEPSNLALCPGTRGGALWRVTFKGNTGLAFSGEEILNPVYPASKFMSFLEKFEAERKAQFGPAPWFEHDSGLPAIVTRVEAGDIQAPLCDVGPTECHVDIWVECHPGTTEAQLKEELLRGFRETYGDALSYGDNSTPEFQKMIRFLPGSEVDPDFPFIPLLADEVQQVTNERPAVQGAPFACDAFMFNEYSPTPAIVLGPKGANAHAPDEYVDLPSLFQLTEIMARTMVQWCKPQN